MQNLIFKTFPITTACLSEQTIEKGPRLVTLVDLEQFPVQLEQLVVAENIPAFLPDLARVEWLLHQCQQSEPPSIRAPKDTIILNPTLQVLEVGWQGLLQRLEGAKAPPQPSPLEAGTGSSRAVQRW